MQLVPNRECGECTACCKFIGIKHPKLEKPTNQMCPHCQPGVGCEVYSSRPEPCSGWFCCWRMLEDLDDSWRPDRSGLVIRPEGTEGGEITVVVLDPEKKYFTKDFASLVATWVVAGMEVAFSRVGPHGFLPVNGRMNAKLIEHLRNKDLASVMNQLEEFIVFADTQWTWESDGLELRSELF